MKRKTNIKPISNVEGIEWDADLHIDKANPSEVTNRYWLHAHRKSGKYPKPTVRSGKWLVFVDKEDVDMVWSKIKKTVEEGMLGSDAKVATAKSNPHATDASTKVICVYTYDHADEEDVRRIRAELRKLGITNRIPYKTDEDTLSGKYRITGHTRISKYFE
ncbi:MAG TPA: putative phosphothreonine lyase domain-containing protein [Dehalococcoidales bacterium]